MEVTVLMPAFNAERYIAEAIESVLTQTYKNFEFLIINDGSTDRTLPIAETFAQKDGRIRLLSQPNMGMGLTLNRGLELARNEWVARMDADDVMMPQRLERQVAFLQAHPEVDVAGCLVYYINSQGRVIGKSTSDLRTPVDFQRYVRANKLLGCHHPGVILRKSVVRDVGGYRPEYWPAEDIDLWNRLAERGHVLLVQQEYLLKYRVHGTSVSVRDVQRARLMLRWLEANMRRRRSGQQEISLEAFRAWERQQPLLTRLNRERRELARALYKRAAEHYSAGHLTRAAASTLLAGILRPGFVAAHVARKVVSVRLSRGAVPR